MIRKLKQSEHKNEWVLAAVFLAMFVLFSIVSRHFLSLTNVMSLLSQMVELGLLTLAMSATMISGGMDLSISAICSLCTVFLGIFIGQSGMPSGLAMLLTLLTALACGVFNGFLVGYLKVPSMLATLGTQSLFAGIGLVVSNGVTVSIPNTTFALFGRTKLGGFFPLQILLWAAAIVVAVLIFSYLVTGRRIYLIGSSMEVARFSGINLRRNLFVTYIFSAVLAFVASLVFTSKISAGRADVADSLLLKTVSASVFGGVSTLGGIGTLGGAMLGVAVITLISNGLDMVNASSYLQQVVIGAMLLIVLAYRHVRRK
ncbi:MAG: ABC transporter permease [Oscillospiraceae bacterium]|nr:ABC transporter permease [Oscillospiraceae bacterium]